MRDDSIHESRISHTSKIELVYRTDDGETFTDAVAAAEHGLFLDYEDQLDSIVGFDAIFKGLERHLVVRFLWDNMDDFYFILGNIRRRMLEGGLTKSGVGHEPARKPVDPSSVAI